MPCGVKVKNLNCKIFFRNARQAFETNASDSSLASLNQSVDVQWAYGLNHSVAGVNGLVTADKKMHISDFKPFSSDSDHYAYLDTLMYGVDEQDTNFLTTVPYGLLSSVIVPKSYYAMYSNDAAKYEFTNEQNVKSLHAIRAGWEDLSKHLFISDAQDVASKCIYNVDYAPRMGFIKKPADSFYRFNDLDKKKTYR